MKYIKKRDSFLTGIQEYKDSTDYNSYDLIKEDSGPLANDIAWGDSLLGRLLHHIGRKAKIRADLMRIKGVAKRLRRALNDAIGGATKNSLEGEDKIQMRRLMIFTFLDELNAAIEKGHKVGIIKNLTDGAIEDITKFEDFEGKKTLLAQLEDFKKFLEQFKDDDEGKDDPDLGEGEGEEETEETEEDETDEEDKDKDKNSEKSASEIKVMVDNLKSLGLVLSYYKNVKSPSKSGGGKKITYITVKGDTVSKIQANPKANPKKLTAVDIRKKNTQKLVKFPKDTDEVQAGLELVMETGEFRLMGFDIFREAFGEGGGKDRNVIKSGEDYLTQAFAKLKKDLEILESPKEKGIGIDSKFINEITNNYLKDPKARESIRLLYKEVNRFLVGDKKSTMPEKDKLYNENIEIISDKNKRVLVAEKIARFSKRAVQFDGQNFYGGLGDMGKPLEQFVNTIKQIMKMESLNAEKLEDKKEGEESQGKETKYKVGDTVSWKNDKGEKVSKKIESIKDGAYVFKTEDGKEYTKKEAELTKDSILFRYQDYLLRLNEAEEGQETSETTDETPESEEKPTGAIAKIQEYWKNNVDIKQFFFKKEEYVKVKENLEKKIEENKDSVTLTIDPILEIVKCFNRAYKLHTTQVIPTARSGGKVTNAKFMEYTSFGGGSQESAGVSGGPYRNNKIFDEWESAVQDCLGDKDFQPLFAKNTKINVGGKIIPDAGSNLRKFMTDMLDGDELYKSKDGKGAQSKFLDKYFGYKEGDDAKNTTFGGEEERQEIETNSESIVEKKQNIQFTKDSTPIKSPSELVGTFFTFTSGGDYDKAQWYGFIQDYAGGYFYVTYTMGAKNVIDIIRRSGVVFKASEMKGENDFLKLDNPTATDKNGDEYVIRATRIAERLFKLDTGKLEKGVYFSSYVQKKKPEKGRYSNKATETEVIKDDRIKVLNFLSLATMEGEGVVTPKILKITTDYNSIIKDLGGFPNIKSTKDIDTVETKRE